MILSDIIAAASASTGLNLDQAGNTVNSFLDIITQSLVSGEKVQITCFGTFLVKTRKARNVVNPQNTSETIAVPESKSPVFKASRQLRDAIQDSAELEETV